MTLVYPVQAVYVTSCFPPIRLLRGISIPDIDATPRSSLSSVPIEDANGLVVVMNLVLHAKIHWIVIYVLNIYPNSHRQH
jgi:hypothetical protein